MRPTCIDCGIAIVKREGRGRQRKRCDVHAVVACSTVGCIHPSKARGLCSTHWKHKYGKPEPKAEFSCNECGAIMLKERSRANKYATMFCSTKCQMDYRHRPTRLARQQVAVIRPKPSISRIILWVAETTPPTRRPRTFATGICRVCGSWFTCLFGSATCSQQCQEKAHRDAKREAEHKRRAVKRDAYRAPVNRRAIYLRDNNTCMLCGGPLAMNEVVPHSLAPTLDHVVPLARGGTHEPANVQAAHFICNARKGDLRGEQVFEYPAAVA